MFINQQKKGLILGVHMSWNFQYCTSFGNLGPTTFPCKIQRHMCHGQSSLCGSCPYNTCLNSLHHHPKKCCDHSTYVLIQFHTVGGRRFPSGSTRSIRFEQLRDIGGRNKAHLSQRNPSMFYKTITDQKEVWNRILWVSPWPCCGRSWC